jgi:hypothetical protein
MLFTLYREIRSAYLSDIKLRHHISVSYIKSHKCSHTREVWNAVMLVYMMLGSQKSMNMNLSPIVQILHYVSKKPVPVFWGNGREGSHIQICRWQKPSFHYNIRESSQTRFPLCINCALSDRSAQRSRIRIPLEAWGFATFILLTRDGENLPMGYLPSKKGYWLSK